MQLLLREALRGRRSALLIEEGAEGRDLVLWHRGRWRVQRHHTASHAAGNDRCTRAHARTRNSASASASTGGRKLRRLRLRQR
jgi:hypothetical protein